MKSEIIIREVLKVLSNYNDSCSIRGFCEAIEWVLDMEDKKKVIV